MINDEIRLIPANGKNEDEKKHLVKIQNKPTNFYELNDIENEQDILFSDQSWLILLFSGWAVQDLVNVKILLELSKKYPEINYGVKLYMDVANLFSFSSSIDQVKATPLFLARLKNKTTLLKSGPLKETELEKLIIDIVKGSN